MNIFPVGYGISGSQRVFNPGWGVLVASDAFLCYFHVVHP